MALESQGVVIRRASTSEISIASSVLAFAVSGTTMTIKSGSTAVIDFGTLGVSTGMRIESNSTANPGAIFTAKAVASSAITLYENCTADTSTTISLVCKTMESVGLITGFNGPSGSAAVIDVTHLLSTAKEKMIGIRDEGQVTLDMLLSAEPTHLQMSLKDDRANRRKATFDIKFTDQSTVADAQPTAIYFDAYVTGYSIS